MGLVNPSRAPRLYTEEKLSVAASALSLSSTYKASLFSEINAVSLYFFSLKIFPMERSSDSQSWKKNYGLDFELYQLLL